MFESTVKNSDLFVIFSEFNELPSDVDWKFISKQKDNEIETLKTKLKELKQKLKNKPKFPAITEKPEKSEKDIFNAIKKGDLQSVQWFIEKEGFNIDKRDSTNRTPLLTLIIILMNLFLLLST